ncbi:MAG: hypothetical protein AAF810_08505 [Cyanobacteria bacterium P01_D01_bin.36]
MEKKRTCIDDCELNCELVIAKPFKERSTPEASTELGCSFTKVTKNGKPALLACFNIQAQINTQIDTQEELSSLLQHAEELNTRLPCMRVSVLADMQNTSKATAEGVAVETEAEKSYLFVLQGLSRNQITTENISKFLTHLTHDFGIFLAYARAHSIHISPNLKTSVLKPFVYR